MFFPILLPREKSFERKYSLFTLGKDLFKTDVDVIDSVEITSIVFKISHKMVSSEESSRVFNLTLSIGMDGQARHKFQNVPIIIGYDTVELRV